MRSSITAVIFAALLLTSACASASRVAPRSAESSPVVRIYDTRAARFVSFDALAAAASKADAVFFGEMHDDPLTHAAELAVLAALLERRPQAVLSLEMFERDVQSSLDDYLAGRVTEKDFLAGARPWDRYATDYRPMVELARIHGRPVIAANIPRRIASAVNRAGLTLFDTLDAKERVWAAAENICPRDAYFTKFSAAMGGGASHGGPPQDSATAQASLKRMYEAQCVKDEAMAESIVRARVAAGDGSVVLHVNGAFHSDERLGTADRVLRRAPGTRMLVLSAVPVPDPLRADPTAHVGKGDYILFTLAPRPVAPR